VYRSSNAICTRVSSVIGLPLSGSRCVSPPPTSASCQVSSDSRPSIDGTVPVIRSARTTLPSLWVRFGSLALETWVWPWADAELAKSASPAATAGPRIEDRRTMHWTFVPPNGWQTTLRFGYKNLDRTTKVTDERGRWVRAIVLEGDKVQVDQARPAPNPAADEVLVRV